MKKLTTEEFIKKAEKIYNDKYDYSITKYINSRHSIQYICPEHGIITQNASSHLMGNGCRYCGYQVIKDKESSTTEDFIKKAREMHGDKYDYSKVNYINSKTKVCIICPEHGEFWQMPHNHLNGHGCDKCGGTFTKNTEEFIRKACEIHGNKYDYSKAEYINNRTKVCIICPEHGEFWQTPDKHLQGRGCPFCKESINEEKCRIFLINRNIQFEQEKKFSWLKDKSYLKLDFYLPEYNIAIEYQGVQHYKVTGTYDDEKKLKERKRRDKLKKVLCREHNINIEYITYKENTINKLIKILDKYENKCNAIKRFL